MVDVLLATFNGEKFISEQIDSVLRQTYQNFRILIRDDNSQDRTVEIIKTYRAKYPDKIVFISDDVKCGSSASNFMQLTRYAVSDYVMYCDQDDFWMPDKIEVTLNKMLELEKKAGSDKPVLVFADYKMADQNLNEMEYRMKSNQVSACHLEFNRLLVQNYVTGCLMMANKALYSMMGEYHKDILMHDWWAALLASSMGVIYHLPKTVMLYRQHEDNVVGAVNVRSLRYRLGKVLDRNTRNMKYLYEKQARLILSRHAKSLSDESLRQLEDFLVIYGYRSKWKRMSALKKGNYLKSDRVRQLGQLWYI